MTNNWGNGSRIHEDNFSFDAENGECHVHSRDKRGLDVRLEHLGIQAVVMSQKPEGPCLRIGDSGNDVEILPLQKGEMSFREKDSEGRSHIIARYGRDGLVPVLSDGRKPVELRGDKRGCKCCIKCDKGEFEIGDLSKGGFRALLGNLGRRMLLYTPLGKGIILRLNEDKDNNVVGLESKVSRKEGVFLDKEGERIDLGTLKPKGRWFRNLSKILLGGALASALTLGATEYFFDKSPRRFDSIEELVEENIDNFNRGALGRAAGGYYYASTNQGVCNKDNYETDRVTGRHMYMDFNGELIMRGNEIFFVNTDRDYRRERTAFVNIDRNHRREREERNERNYTLASIRFDEIRASLGEDYVIPIEEGELGYPFEIPCNIINLMETLTEYHDGRIPPSHWWEGAGLHTSEVRYSSAFNVYDDFKDNEGNPTLPNELRGLLPAQVLVESIYTLDADSDPVIAGTKRLSEKVFESCTAQDRGNYYKLPYGVRCLYTYYDKSINEFKESLEGINANDEEKTQLALYLTMQSFRSDIGTVLQEQESRDFLEELLQDNLSPPEAVHRYVMSNHGEAAHYLPYIFAFREAMNNYIGGPVGN